MRRRVLTLFRWANVILILCTFLAYLSPYINPVNFWIPSFFGLAYPWLLLLNILFIVFWLLNKKKYFLFSLFCIIMGWGHLTNFFGLSFTTGTTKGKEIRVMSFNAKRGMVSQRNVKKTKEKDLFLKFLKKNGPYDIICFQESPDTDLKKIPDYLGLKYQQLNIKFGVNTSIISRYPIIEKGGTNFLKSSNSFAWADIQIGKKIVRVYSVHLQSNQVSGDTDKVIAKGDIKDKKTWLDIRTVLTKIKRRTQQRIEQALILIEHMEQSPYPIILCGDFNDSPLSYTYHIIAQKLKDTFQERGFGFGTTYAGNIPALRIDYILVDRKLKTLDCSIIREVYSDHYPVISTIGID